MSAVPACPRWGCSPHGRPGGGNAVTRFRTSIASAIDQSYFFGHSDEFYCGCSWKERLCCLNKDGKYNSIHKPAWTTRSGTQEQLDNPVSANDMCALDEWPSHARRNRAQLHDEADG